MTARQVDGPSILVTWMPPLEPNGVITSYDIHYAGYKDLNQVKSALLKRCDRYCSILGNLLRHFEGCACTTYHKQI